MLYKFVRLTIWKITDKNSIKFGIYFFILVQFYMNCFNDTNSNIEFH